MTITGALTTTAATAIATAAVLLAAPAHADEQTYLDQVLASPIAYRNTTGLLQAGHWVCDKLHEGASPDAIPPMTAFWTAWVTSDPNLVDAAQHQLCPDTLR